MFRYASLVYSAIALGWAIIPAAAQSPPATVVKATPGKQVLVGYYSFARNDCTGGAVPQIHVTSAPQHGLITIKPATLATKRLQQCGTVKMPTLVIAYKANDGFTGSDTLAFDLTNTETGKTQPVAVTLTVTQPNTSL